jgi:hypothetical protein
MAERPDASTPRQTESWSDCKAVYRLFQRPEVTFESVTIGHRQRPRNLLPGTYLAISDTTELDYGYDSPRRGLGRLTSEKHRGFFLHTALVLDAEDGHVVGVGGQKLFTRSAKKKKRVHRVNGCKRASEAEIWGQVIDQANGKQQARWTEVEVRAAEVTLLRPREGSTAFVIQRDIREIPTWVVEVREVRPPQKQQPLHWVLYSRESASTFEEALRAIAYYEQRPRVEDYHKCLKTGLAVERRRYQSGDRLEPVIGVICVQAVRLLQLRDLVRKSPETPAKGVVPVEWLETLQRIRRRPTAIHTV